MAKRQFQLTGDEIEYFRQRESRTRDVHELKRLQATRLYGSGITLPQIMSGIGCGESVCGNGRWIIVPRAWHD